MNVLHIEDCVEDAELVKALLTDEWPLCSVDVVSNKDGVISRLKGPEYDLVLSDFSMGSFTGLDALKIVQSMMPRTPFIFLSGTIGEDRAIEAVRAGAQDYIIKDRMKRLVTAIHRALKDARERGTREAAEQRLRQQAELLDRARDAIMVTNLDGVVTFWNQGAERISGWSLSDAVGRRIDEVLGVGSHIGIETARKTLDEQDEWRGEFHLLNKAGKLLVMDISASLIRDNAGKPIARLKIGTDVTANRDLEQQFLRIQRLESIGMLASGIAHDLNNVLAPILMAAPMLRLNASNPRDIRILATVEKSAERGAALVRQILSFAHGVSGAHQLIQVKHLLRDTISVVHETFPKNILVEEKVPGDLWTILGNPTQVHQVLLNLSVNARDAMPAGGKLTIRAENRVLTLETAAALEGARPGSWLVLHVEDSGTGIPPEVLLRIWEPFFTTKGVGKGTGLGLSTVRGIVENHKGFIDLKTEPGKGTVIRVYLPAAEGTLAEERPASANPFPHQGSGEVILLVDDEATIREVTAAALTDSGYCVVIARDGKEAMMRLAMLGDDVRVVITDIGMPNLDGSRLATAVHHLNRTIKILAMSGMDNRTEGAKAAAFADAFLFKPFKTETLLKEVHQLLHPVSERLGK